MSLWGTVKTMFKRRRTVKELLEYKKMPVDHYSRDYDEEDHIFQLKWRRQAWDLDSTEIELLDTKIETLEARLRERWSFVQKSIDRNIATTASKVSSDSIAKSTTKATRSKTSDPTTDVVTHTPSISYVSTSWSGGSSSSSDSSDSGSSSSSSSSGCD